MKRMIIVVLMAALVAACGAALAQEATGSWQAEMDALLAHWEALYAEESGWNVEDLPVHENTSLPVEGELTREEALAAAVREVCAMRGIEDLAYFEKLRPFLGFSSERNWVVSLLPTDPLNEPEWAYWVTVDAGTGALVDYRQGEPMEPSDFDLSDEPKG